MMLLQHTVAQMRERPYVFKISIRPCTMLFIL